MSLQEIIKKVNKDHIADGRQEVAPGDTVTVSMKIIEGGKERVQLFTGTVIQKRGAGTGKTFTVRKVSNGVYVERIFPFHSPLITDIKIGRKGRVRRAKLYYLRDLTGKATRLKEVK